MFRPKQQKGNVAQEKIVVTEENYGGDQRDASFAIGGNGHTKDDVIITEERWRDDGKVKVKDEKVVITESRAKARPPKVKVTSDDDLGRQETNVGMKISAKITNTKTQGKSK